MKCMGVVLVCAALLLSGTTAQARPEAEVRVVHASPDAPAVDVWVNGAPAFTNWAFGEVTPYAPLEFGRYQVQVVPTGEVEPVVIDANLFLRPMQDYTVVAVGFLSDIEPLVLVDHNRFPPLAHARVRFVHASPDAPAVDVALQNGPVLFADVAFKESGGYIYVAPGTYDLEVRLAGTSTVVLPLPGISLEGGTVYTAFAIGLAFAGAGEPPLQALLTEDAVSPFKGQQPPWWRSPRQGTPRPGVASR